MDAPTLSSRYQPLGGHFDEMAAPDGTPRAHWGHVAGALEGLGLGELQRRAGEAARLLDRDGAVYNSYDRDGRPGERWRLDTVPTVIDSREWQELEHGIAERAELLSAILEDIYGPRELLRRGLLPAEVVFAHDGFLRACDGVRLPSGPQLFTYACDLARDRDGRWFVLSDRTQAPSGFGYALENRTVTSRVLPSLFRDAGVHRLEPYLRALRSGLLDIAPIGTDDPRVVVLTPGPFNETAYEHAVLSSRLGFPLVEGSDLVVRSGRVRMHTLGSTEPVDVILRRVDASYCDPLELRSDSRLGVAGLVEATRRGAVSVANTLGSSILENPALMRFLPGIAQHLLGRELSLPSVPAWWCGDAEDREHVLANTAELVLRPVVRQPGVSSVFGGHLDDAGLAGLRADIERRPAQWVAHAPLTLSTTPTLTPEGLVPRRSVLRSFAVARADSFVVMPGGLTRVAPDDGDGPIASQAGAIAKDTWVLASEPERLSAGAVSLVGLDPSAVISPRAAENLWWLGRYAERAQHVLRLLRVVNDRRNEFAGRGDTAGDAALDVLLDALGQATGAPLQADAWTEIVALLGDDRRPGSVAHAVRLVLQDAYAVRDQLSPDTWLVVGDLDRRLMDLRGRDVAAPELQAMLQRGLRTMLAIGGIVDDSMVRDAGWHFLDAGRRLERALGLVALLRATQTGPQPADAGPVVLESVLTVLESVITYRRRYRSHAQLLGTLELLLTDELNPRALAFQLSALERDLAVLPRGAAGRLRRDEREVVQALTALRVADLDALAEGDERTALADFLDAQNERLLSTARFVEAEHFMRQLPLRRVQSL